MASDVPKQYLPLAGRTVIEYALAPFLAGQAFERVVVVLSAGDTLWPRLPVARDERILTAVGGATRAESVLAGLERLRDEADPQDWVLVHDAARPCLEVGDLHAFISVLEDDPVGGLLAAPLSDTLKRADVDLRVAATIPREGLWRALTPQMFRYRMLRDALERCRQHGIVPTDEAAAIESLGFKPRLVAGSADNCKVTLPEDLAFAARLLAGRDGS